MEVLLTSAEVMARTGITARQLQWWDERGIVVPSRQGHRRLYSLDDLAEIAVICDLRRRGFSLQRVRKVIRLLQKEFKKRLVDTVSSHSEYHLLTDGHRIYLKDTAEQVIDILKNSRQPMLTVCLTDTVRQIQAEATGRQVAGELGKRELNSDRVPRKPGQRKRAASAVAGLSGRRVAL
jgi:DNA-binding transcriptional MerR regulator